MNKIIVVKTLYVTTNLTKNPLYLSNVSKAFVYQLIIKDSPQQLITRGSLDVSNMSKAYLAEIIVMKNLYMTTNLTKKPL